MGLEEEHIKRVVNETLDERKKRLVPKFFHNPHKAYDLFGWMVIVVFVLAAYIALSSALTSPSTNTDYQTFEQIVIQNSSCETLKVLLLEANHDPKSYFRNIINDLNNEITARC